jgi:hypothetical protein
MTKQEIQNQIDKLEKALKSPAMSDQFRENFEEQIKNLKKKLDTAEEESKKPSEKKDGMVKVKTITILWAEGNQSNYPKFPKSFKTWKEANDVVKKIYDDNKESGAEGYNKSKFQIQWEDGEDYEGRLDVSEKEDNPYKSSNVIGEHVRDWLTYLMSEPKTSNEDKQEIMDFLAKYDLGLVTKAKPSVEKSKEEKTPAKEKIETPSSSEKKKKSVPLPDEMVKKDEYDCDELIRKAKERKAKAQERAKLPKKSEATKNKEKIETVFENVQERVKSDDITKAELLKLIKETEELLKVLRASLAKLK